MGHHHRLRRRGGRGSLLVGADLLVDDIDAATARVVDLGGDHTGERHDYDTGVVVVMADPEGTQFCVVQLFGSAQMSEMP